MPLSDSEVARILNQVEEGADKPRSLVSYEVGEQVNVVDGPFEGFLVWLKKLMKKVNSEQSVSVNFWKSHARGIRVWTSSKTNLIFTF